MIELWPNPEKEATELKNRKRRDRYGKAYPALMFISSSDYTDLESKGVAGMLNDRDEDGFFKRVVSVHPWAKNTRKIAVSANHELLEYGPEWVPLAKKSRSFRRLLAPVIVARSALMIRNTVRREGISVVRASDPFWTALLGWSVSTGTGVPFVVSIHADWLHRSSLDPNAIPRLFGSFTLARILARFNLRRANFVIVIRESLVDVAAELGAPLRKVLVMPHMVEDELFGTYAGPAHDIGEAPYAFFAGRLSRENYVYDMLESMRLLPQDSHLRLILAGDGAERHEIADAVARDPVLRKRVILLGSIPRDQVQTWRQSASVNLCLMGGYSLIEAAASGRPVIAYDVEWHSELVINDRTGLLVPEGDVEGVAAALEVVTKRPDFAKQLGCAGREHARQRHARSNVTSARRHVYESILGNSGT